MLSSIPSYINAKSLVINRTGSFNQNDGRTQELTAVDPEGDTITLGEWTEDVGPATVLPEQRFYVTYHEEGQEPTQPQQIYGAQAYPLYQALDGATRAENADPLIVDYLFSRLAQVGGIGGAC